MKTKIQHGQFNFLIYQKNDIFIGICKETGYVEEGNTEQEVMHRLLNGTKAIYEAVKKDRALLPSINQKPALKYLFLFYWIPLYYSLKNILHTYKVEAFNLTPIELCNQA